MTTPAPQVAAPSPERTVLAVVRRFVPYLWPADQPWIKRRLVAAAICILLAKLTQVFVVAYSVKRIVDQMALPREPSAVFAAGLLVAAYAFARLLVVLFDNVRDLVFEAVGKGVGRRINLEVFKHLHSLSYDYHVNRRTGAVLRTVERGVKSVDQTIYWILFNIVPTIFEFLLILLVFGINFGPGLALATAAAATIYIAFTKLTSDWRARLKLEMIDADTVSVARVHDSLTNYDTVKYFAAEEKEAVAYDQTIAAYMTAAVRFESSIFWVKVGQSLIVNLTVAATLMYVVIGWSNGVYSAGDVIFVSTLLLQVFQPLDTLGQVYNLIREGILDMSRMFDLLDDRRQIMDAPDATTLCTSGGKVRFENVSFAYPDRAPVLRELDFEVPAGATWAIVGPSGAGKSTIAKLLFRFYDVGRGRILIDDQDVSRVTRASLVRHVGVVAQDTVLFNGSIGFNIGYGVDSPAPEQLMEAARAVSIDTLIDSLPNGLAMPVGERGLKLSSGEKQRVAIARTLLKDCPVLILDEATSALDTKTERQVLDLIRTTSRGRTVIMIAHRLSTIVDADCILVIEGGRIVERGKHDELVERGGLYTALWRQQALERSVATDVS